MSYDLLLYRPIPGHGVEDAHTECADLFDADESAASVTPTTFTPWSEAELMELAHLIMKAAPEYAEGDDPEAPIDVNPDGSICLQAPEAIFSDWELMRLELSVNWPYGRDRAELERIFDPVRRGLVAMREKGARVYDPQLGREFDPQRDFEALAAVYLQVNQRVFQGPAGASAPAAARKRWWKFW